MVGILSPDLPAILSIKKLAGHSDIQTTQQYYLSVQEDDLEKARQVQSEILGGVLTDPLWAFVRVKAGTEGVLSCVLAAS